VTAVRSDVLSQIWPVFVAEAHEHVAAIGAVVVEIARNPSNAEAVEGVRRTAHGLKGSAASLGLRDLELLAHAIEEVLTRFDPVRGLTREAVQAILDALEGIEAGLAAADAGGEPRVPGREGLVAALHAARDGGRSDVPPAGREPTELELLERAVERLCTPLGPGERAAITAAASTAAGALAANVTGAALGLAERISRSFAELGAADDTAAARGAARLAGELLQLRDALAPAPAAATAPHEPGAAQAADGAQRGEREDRAVRVLASTLDSLARRLEMLSLAESRHGRRARELAESERELREAVAAIQSASAALRAAGVDLGRTELELATARLQAMGGDLRRLAREGQRETEQQRLTGAVLREDLRALRMVPAALAMEPARRAIREVALRLGKEVEVRLEGGDVRLDRRLVDDLRAPLLHLVRNAVDHGIEPAEVRRAAGKPEDGLVTIRVEPRGSRVGVIVEDDGGGIDVGAVRAAAIRAGLLDGAAAARLPDAEAARLVFAPGLSTARSVTTVSGRGVGLDAVADAIGRMRGAVEVRSEPGVGTRFELDLPLALAATSGVIARVGDVAAVVPADAVERVLLLESAAEARAAGAVWVGDLQLPFTSLAEVLGLDVGQPPARAIGLVFALGSQRAVVAVDEVLGEQDVVVSALGGIAARVPHLAGATLLDDGRVLGVLDPGEILRRLRPSALPGRAAAAPRRTVVVADDTIAARTLMAGLIETAGFAVRIAADGDAALALVESGPCDLLVSDVQMPRLDGIALTRRLRSDPRWKALPIVLVSTLDAPVDVEGGLEAGATAYLSKREIIGGALAGLVQRLLGEGSGS
jgi:two-component system chemotaxis sensor kinase CheA